MDRINPAFQNNNIAIVFASNDYFTPYMAVMIQSILDHVTSENNYDIIVLHGSISRENQTTLETMSHNYSNVSIRFVDVDPIFDSWNLFTDIRGMRLTRETYYRMSICQVLSDAYKKAIYLDGDMVTLTDVAQLNNIDLEGFYLAATYDIPGIAYCYRPGNDRISYRKNVLQLTDVDSYFIAGLLVLNLPQLRRDYPGDALIQIAASKEWRQHDQDVMNVICNNGKAKLLHPEWNVLMDFGNNRYLPDDLKIKWLESENQPKIIHYGGNKKPWNANIPREKYFWATAARTPFWSKIVTSMLQDGQDYKEEEWPAVSEHIESVRLKVLNDSVKPERNHILAELARMDSKYYSDTSNPLVSVIVPVYNEEAHLEKCLNSIINQTYHNLEIIIVDDGSTDHSAEICDRYAASDDRIRVLHKNNGGVASARNAGLEMVTGDYIGWVDSDDWISCDMYEYLVSGVKKYHTPVVICGHINVNNDGSFRDCTLPNTHFMDETLMLGEALKRLVDRKIRNYLYDRLWERRVFDNVRFKEGVVFEDLRIIHKLFMKARWITHLSTPKYYRNIHKGSIVMSFSIKNRIQSVTGHLDRHNELVLTWPSLQSSLLKQIGIAITDLSRAIAQDTVRNYKVYEGEIGNCLSFLRANMEAILQSMNATPWQNRALHAMAVGNRTGWITGYFILRMERNKERQLKKLKKTKGKFKKKLKKTKGVFKKKLKSIRHLPEHLTAKVINKDHTSQTSPKPEKTTDEKAKALQEALDQCIQNRSNNETVEDAKKRFFMSIPKAEGDVALLQRGNLYLLKRLNEICKLHNIRYWLIGGTLIGAVRHKGFIPWDDDVDVAILREDLIKLEEIINLYPELRIDRYYHSKGPWQTVKLTFTDDSLPFWVDLLLYDYAGDRTIPADALWDKIQIVRKGTVAKLRRANKRMKMTYSDMIIDDVKDAEEVDNVYANAFVKLPAVLNRDYVYRSIDCVCGKWQQLFPVEKMMPFSELEFMGEIFPAPKEYEWYLQKQYGDYNTIPDVVSHIHNRFIGERLQDKEAIQKKLDMLEQIERGLK